MTTGDICVITAMGYPIISGIIGLYLIENCDDKISEGETVFCTICWTLIIVFVPIFFILNIVLLPIFYIIKIIKQHNKLKETNKIEENKRKKELVDNVLKELKLR